MPRNLDRGRGAGTLDPGRACQDAIDAGLLVIRADPLNAETQVSGLADGAVTPTDLFYLRNNFPIPDLNGEQYRLSIGGLVERELDLSLAEIRDMPSETRILTLECAGNGRRLFEPAVPGEPWALGAVSTAQWTGVPLARLLDLAGMRPQASEIVFRGADSGSIGGIDGPVRFERSLPADRVCETGALLAYAMNGEALPPAHGYPLRLIVPGWYAVASVKWLTEILVTDRPFDGYFQTTRYWYEWARAGGDEREPVTLINVRALIASPAPGAALPRGETAIRGVAWSGAGRIARVDVGLNGGPWQEARLTGEGQAGAWQGWALDCRLDEAGPLTVRARATDAAGRTQPDQAEWNRLGYGNNSIHSVDAEVI